MGRKPQDAAASPRAVAAPGVTPSVSIVIPVHRGGNAFEACLSALAAADPAAREVIVVADGGGADDRRIAAAFGAEVLSTAAPGGPARARNLGARHASGDVLFFVDADVVPEADAVARVAGAFREAPDLAALFGAYDDAPAATNFLSQYKNLLHHYVHVTSRAEASTFWGACGAVRREVFLALGGFDERYGRPSIEDIEFGYRLRRAGHRIRLVKELRVKHLKRWTVTSLLRSDIFDRALPWTRLIVRGEQFIDDLNLNRKSRRSVALMFLLVAALAAAPLLPWLAAAAVPVAALLFWLNRDLYGFFRRRRGGGFAACAVLWHWLYFLYGGLAFGVGLVRYRLLGKRPGSKRVPAA
ncbi:MAG: glycosyltransferase [Planctomycetes bacterium]|nr:glycosyltransferase [Planctomycetota bacterium]